MMQLDSQQRCVADAAPEERQIVLAGPGAGKSEVVGALAAQLVDKGVYPEEILVISFSRAAVDVVRRRTAGVTDEGRTVDVATIDSLAARLLVDHCTEEHRFIGHDKTITDALKLLVRAEEPPLDHLRHVVVDEVQDVVADRAAFVLSLLARGVPVDTGFTLLGDPLQALYDFQLDSGSKITSTQLLEKIRMQWTPHERDLRGDYRSQSDDARRIITARPSLLETVPSRRLPHLRKICAELAPLGELGGDSVEDIAGWDGTTALLCDTNARAGLAADQVAHHGVRAELAASALDPGVPAWVAEMITDTGRTMMRSEFLERADAIGLIRPDERWLELMDLAGGSRGLDLSRLVERLADSREARRLGGNDRGAIVASTVHRAKGIEFDNVVLVAPEEWDREDRSAEDLAAMLYVAMSRSRARVTTVTGVPTRGWLRLGQSRLRPWVCRGFRGKGYSQLMLEPSGARELGPTDHDLQDAVGSAVEWVRGEDHADEDGVEVPSWTALVDGSPVARTGVELGRTVGRLRFSSYGRCPSLLGGRVEGLETIVDPRGRNGRQIWLGARVSGPVRLDWSDR